MCAGPTTSRGCSTISVRSFDDVKRSLNEEADYIVVGSGAGGGTAAWTLSNAGHDVLIVEEGPPASRSMFSPQFFPAMNNLYREGGLEAFTGGRAVMSTLQGRVVGGTTVVNAAIAWRMPESTYEQWAGDPAIRAAFPLEELHRHWDILDKKMFVTPTDLEIAGRGNTLAAQACEAMGWKGKVINRFTHGCEGAGRCVQGCPNNAKMSTALTLIPEAIDNGARVLASCLVDKVTFDDWGRALGVTGRMRDPIRRRRGPKVSLRARKGVVLAPGCIQLPGLLEASGVKHERLGMHFQAHPGSAIIPVFEDRVDYWSGATQGWESDEFFKDGMKFEVVNVPVEVNAGRLPGVGSELAAAVRELPYAASWGVIVRMAAHGTVRSKPGHRARVAYTPTTADMERVQRGLYRLTKMAFAGGARKVFISVHGLKPVLEPGEEELILESSLDPRAYAMYASHLFGTARAAGLHGAGVCDPDLRPWGTKNLWVVDSSVFPTNLGVNPQFSIQAVSMHASEKIAEAG